MSGCLICVCDEMIYEWIMQLEYIGRIGMQVKQYIVHICKTWTLFYLHQYNLLRNLSSFAIMIQLPLTSLRRAEFPATFIWQAISSK